MVRLDTYFSEKFSMTRNRAKFCIDSDLVLVNGVVVNKVSYDVKEKDLVTLQEDKRSSFVARSAVKLDDFLVNNAIVVKDFTCLDVGASTGWFTQVLLGRGAKKVIALDVGTSQLHESLRSDSRVVSLENTDIREVKLDEVFNLIVVDVSFISLRKIVPSLQKIMSENTQLILLFKPQFEVGKEFIRKTGVPKDEKIIKKTLDDFCGFLRRVGLKIQIVQESTLPWEAGNREWLLFVN